jgi:hypothetical protein
VGIVPDLAGLIQSKFIIERNKLDLEEKIKIIYENRELLEIIGDENRLSVETEWTSAKSSERIFDFFMAVKAGRHSGRF